MEISDVQQQLKDSKQQEKVGNEMEKEIDESQQKQQGTEKPLLYGHHKKKKINKKHKKEEEIVYKNLNAFKEQQKHYKLYQNKQTDFSTLFDINSAQCKVFKVLGYRVYCIPSPQNGAYLIKNFNSPQIVNTIAHLGLNTFCKKPYRTNLNSRNQLYQKQEKQSNPQQKGQQANKTTVQAPSKQEGDWLPEVSENQFTKQIQTKGYCFDDKIRWANIGHQYDWTLRKYPEYHTPMHESIQSLTERANTLYNGIMDQKVEYKPESAIINFYGVKDYMTGHLDDAEIDQTSPIYSFSFGLSCVFLMGGIDKDQKPAAVQLDSGDLFIMAQNSRKCYHGVPRIIAGTYVPKKQQEKQDGKPDCEKRLQNSPQQAQQYLSTHRININIRQVFPKKG